MTTCGRLVSPCYVTLAATWRPYTITLPASLDLHYVLGGFGWVTNAPQNGGRSIEFYLDDIRYDKAHLDEPRFLQSYATLPANEGVDLLYRNTAFTYDNALALIAFTTLGDQNRAHLLAEALVYAQAHDRYYDDGRLRNCYQAGGLMLPPGWTPNGRMGTARVPGWWQGQQWFEDRECVGSTTGNLAWAIIALLNYYDRYGGSSYLTAARQLGAWIQTQTYDERGAGGYTGGYLEWEPNQAKQLWKSTEHNIDLYGAFTHLQQHRAAGDPDWSEAAAHARQFVEGMWNEADGFYWTGTVDDGVTINQQAIPLDTQSWTMQAFGANARTTRAMAYATSHHHAIWGPYEGFDFNTDRDQPWPEGTGQMVVSYAKMGDAAQAQRYRLALQQIQATAQHGDGRGLVAAPADGLTTGFGWLYPNRLHVGATAWFVFAALGVDPYDAERPDLSPSQAQASLAHVACGDVVSYTLILANSKAVAANAVVTNAIPLHTAYLPGSASASDGHPVTLEAGALHWAGQVTAAAPVTVTFAVQTLVAPASTLVNVAHVSDGFGNTLDLLASSTYRAGYSLTINDGTLFTRFPTVTLRYCWDPADGATQVKISNDGGFGAGTITQVLDPDHPTYQEWQLSTYGSLALPRHGLCEVPG